MKRASVCLVLLLGMRWAFCQTEPNYSIQPKQLADMVETAADIAALVRTEEGSGTGFYLNYLGTVITARHVIKLQDGSTAKHITIVRAIPASKVGGITFKDSEVAFTATVEIEDPEHDLALLRLAGNPFSASAVSINGRDPFQPHHFASICPRTIILRSGDPVFTIGFPFGDRRPITTAGIIASSQPNEFDAAGQPKDTYLVDMTINHGNSGGPVFSSSVGCIIGVADAITPTDVEAIGDKHLFEIDIPLLGDDGKPLLKDGKPMKTTLVYSSRLGILIPQQYLLEMLDKAGAPKMPPLKQKQ